MFRTFTLTNPLAGYAMPAFLGLLLFTLLPQGIRAEATVASGAIARIENLTKLPGSDRGFPAEDFFTLHRSRKERNNSGGIINYTDRSKMRIHNDGTGTLIITKLTTTNTNNFRINGVTIPTDGLRIAPGAFRDVEILFLTNSGDIRQVVTERLVMESNADNASSVQATFRGAYMQYTEGGAEINVQQAIDAFGFSTRLGVDDNGNLQVRPGSAYPDPNRVNAGLEGDLILSGLFEQANPNVPVRIIQMAAFHGPGGAPTELRNEASTRILESMKFNHGSEYHQTLLPRITNDSREPAGVFTSRITEPFQILVAGYRSTGGTYQNTRKDELLAIRVYKAIDRSGRVIPNEYIFIMDYIGEGCGAGSSNCDWNDNVSYITNVRPLAQPAARALAAATVEAGSTKTINTSSAFDRGYAGNVLSYSITAASGGQLPSWISINSGTGSLVVAPPATATDQQYDVRVTATDLNRLRVSTTIRLTVEAGETPPDDGGGDEEPTEDGHYWLEAECATVGSNWELTDNAVVASRRSMSAPPADAAENRIRFTFEVATAGNYNLFARLQAPNGDSDSYWVRTNGGSWHKWFSGIKQGATFAWNRLPTGLNLRAGINTIDFAYREDDIELDKIYVTTAASAPFGAGSPGTNCAAEPSSEVFWLEAECAQVGSRWTTVSNSGASGTEYVVVNGRNSTSTPPTDEQANRVRFTLIGAAAGDYRLLARIDAPSGLDDSYWVRVNGGSWYKWFSGIRQRAGFQWNELPQRFTLREGLNTVDFAYREDGARLDKLLMTTGATQPRGLGEPASNCSAAARIATAPQTELLTGQVVETTTELFPNPVTDRVNLSIRAAHTGEVQLTLTDLHGRSLRTFTQLKEQQDWQVELPVANLPAGLYQLRVVLGDELIVRSFVRR